ncbi:hypothetical protein HDU91_001180 [Kappamyces sp. JEL0680]|nr:hypothetical protein HDU91_001180 [Kappamyces sp. JEL0680]
MLRWLLFCPFLQSASLDQTSRTTRFTACLAPNTTSTIILPSAGALFDTVRTGERARVDRYPLAVFQARTEQDIISAVVCAQQAGLQIVPRGGGHSYEDFSSQDRAVVIDTAGNHDIVLVQENPSDASAIYRVGAGARLGNVYAALAKDGYNFNAGTCPSVGIGGHVGGGGYGMLARLYGLAADQVQEIRVVLYNGTLVVANATEHPDLYWALRGGNSGSFGVVTEYSIRAHKTPQATVFRILYEPSAFTDLAVQWTATMPNIDPRLTVQFQFGRNYLYLVGQWTGAEQDLYPVLDASGMRSFGVRSQEFHSNCSLVGLKAFINSGSCDLESNVSVPIYLLDTDKDYGKYKADYASLPLTREGANAIAELINTGPWSAWIQFEAMGGAVKKEPSATPSATHRLSLYSMQYAVSLGKNEPKTSDNWNFIYALEKALKPYTNGLKYQNYPDLDNGADYGVQYFGAENFARLQQIKKQYDPNNVFSNEQSIPVAP